MDFFSSGPGQYIVQTVFHSAIIALVVEAITNIWRINKPSTQIRFRFLALLLPILYLPVYYLAYPERAGTHFHEQIALMDFNQWLRLRLGGGMALWHLFIALLALTTIFFVFREGIPSIRHYFVKRHQNFPPVKEGEFPKLDSALANLAKTTGKPAPTVLLSPSNSPVIYALGHGALVVSAPTIDILDDKELESVIAHELAHIVRQASAVNWLLLALRFLMFYNPVALLVFRHIVSDNERICDDMAVSLSGKRLAFASGLLKVFQSTPPKASQAMASSKKGWLSLRADIVGRQAHVELVRRRVERLASSEIEGDASYENFRLVVTSVLLVVLLFFVV